jgi:hypothetical protein
MSLANKLRLIKAAREAGMSDAEILREVLGGANMGAKGDANWWSNGVRYWNLARAKPSGLPTLPD